MAANRAGMKSALFDRLQASLPTVKTFRRRWIDFDSLPDYQQPAAILVTDSETPENRAGLPPVWTIGMELWLCAKTTSTNESPETQLDALVSAVESGLEAQPGEYPDTFATTLGGVCKRCWISGPVDILQGVTGGQALAIVPIEIIGLG